MSYELEMVVAITGTDDKALVAYVTSQLEHPAYIHSAEYAAVKAYWYYATELQQAAVIGMAGQDDDTVLPTYLEECFETINEDITALLMTDEEGD